MVQPIRYLEDLKDGSVQAECRTCGRVALFSPYELQTHWRRKGWRTDWPEFALRLRCQCGARGPRVTWSPSAPPPDDNPPPPRPRFARPKASQHWKPPGVDQSEWDRARDDRERRRIVRRARG